MIATADVKYNLNTTSIGVLTFTQDNVNSPVKITGRLTGLSSNISLGDLTKKKIYPTLWWLYRDGFLPECIRFIGYIRSQITIEKTFENAAKYMKENECEIYEKFVQLNTNIAGLYDNRQDFEHLNVEANKLSQEDSAHRIFYLALPPSIYKSVTELINLASSNKLSLHLSKFFTEEEIYRIDHYLGKEMVQNIIVLRFVNQILSRVWNRDSIAAVLIIFKEDIGTQGRDGYFDEFGIIRDVIQNHLMQILSIIAMKKPRSTKGEDIRDEKVKLLRSVAPIKIEDVVIGQYIDDKDSPDVEH
ncbi:unnamed protein product [Rotaria sordida]|uniref:glucose-6-phosphate dehydrogenase (NADP(+)) n=1 Tax=Rotaria sordida TaxID=392033 RepID=A0A819M6G2_9BILA|nr:unnamed protein product [Rotaria sordida]CAF3974444.1 unnamed protein product [Rotaria sordida]